MPDSHKNFAYALVAIAPVPAISGVALTLEAGGGARLPAAPFNATVWPAGQIPTAQNAEIVRVTQVVGDVATITRAQEGSAARAILATDQFAATITAKTLTDVEAAVDVVSTVLSNEISVRTSQRDLLSQAISVVSQAASAALSVAMLASGLAAAETSNRVSADNALSQAVSVVSQALSVETAARIAGVNTVSNGLSNEISARIFAINVQSQNLSIFAQQAFDEISNRQSADNALSQGISVLSQQASIASQRLSTLKGGLVSQYLVKTGAGDFAFAWTSVLAGGVGSVTSAQRESLSNQISNETSARILANNGLSQSLSILSQQVSLLSQAHSVLSQAHSVLSNSLSNEISNRTSADNAVSAQAASAVSQLKSLHDVLSNVVSSAQSAGDAVSADLTSVKGVIAGVSARTTAGTSVRGLQSAINALSSRMSQIVGGTGSVTSTEVSAGDQAVSLQAASALSQALSILSVRDAALSNAISNNASIRAASVQTASAAATSVLGILNGVSARTTAGISVKGLQSVVNALSSRLSQIVAGTGSVTSTELSAGDAAVSAQAASAISQLKSIHDVLSNLVSDSLSAGQVISADVTSLKAVIAGVSARTTAGVSVHGLQSVVNALSSRMSQIAGGAGSVTSTEVSAGNAATSAQAASALSQAVSVINQAISVVSVNSASVNTRLNNVSTLSWSDLSTNTPVAGLQSVINALSSMICIVGTRAVSAEAAGIVANNYLSGVSARTTAGTSVRGLQSVVNALSSRMSQIAGGAGSVTSTEVSAGDQAVSLQAASALSQALSVLSNKISLTSAAVTSVNARMDNLSATAFLDVSTVDDPARGLQSVIRALQAYDQMIVSTFGFYTGLADAHANAASAAATSVLAGINAVSARTTAATSVRGLQSIVNALSSRISQAGGGGTTSVTSTEVSAGDQAVSLQAASALSQALSVVSQNLSVQGAALSVRIDTQSQSVSVLSQQVSVNGAALSNLTSAHNALSNLVSNALSAGDQASNLLSIHSQQISILSQQVSALSQAHSVLSQAHSVLSQQVSVISAGLGLPQMRVIQGAQVISATAFTNVSGLSLSVTSAAVYRIEGRVLFTVSIVTGTAFGFTYPAGVGPGVMTMEFMANNAGTPGNLTSANYVANRLNEASMSTVATAQMSLVAQLASATTGELEIYGLIRTSATAGAIQLQAKQSAAGGGVQFLAGSYLQAFRVL